jgi:predicted nucleic acid-binding protein
MIVLDTNVVLEILEKRGRLQAVAHTLNRYKDDVSAVSTLTLSNVFYLVEKHKNAVTVAEELLKTYRIIGVAPEDAAWAFARYNGKDFEDALQVAAAMREKCSAFLTIDAHLARKYGKLLNVELIGG